MSEPSLARVSKRAEICLPQATKLQSVVEIHSDTEERHESYLWEVAEMLLCAISIYTCFMVYGWYQERIFKTPRGAEQELFSYSMLLVCCQSMINAGCAGLKILVSNQPRNTVPLMDNFKISCSYIGAMLASTTALRFVSYPTQVLIKSCKLIPVMLMRMVLVGKRYTKKEFAAVGLITLGVMTFMAAMVAGREDEGTTSFQGLLLLLLSLTLDGFTSPKQESLKQLYTISKFQMMFWMNFFSACLLIVGLLSTGELFSGWQYCVRNPSILLDIAYLSLCFGIGQLIIFHTLFRFDSLFLVVITTTRKLFSILLSVLWYGHALVSMQWFGILLVFSGLSIDVFNKFELKNPASDSKSQWKRYLLLFVAHVLATLAVYTASQDFSSLY